MEVLCEAGAEHHASLFARHKITWETLQSLTDSELKEVCFKNHFNIGLVQVIANMETEVFD